MKFKNVLLSILCIFVFALTACSSNTNGKEEGNGKLKVVTTYSIIYDMVKQLVKIKLIIVLFQSELTRMNMIHYQKML